MNQESQEVSPGDTVWFASLAYIAVLLPWTILIAHDFISDRWDTIRKTKKAGKLHLLGFILAPVLISYVIWQPMSNEPDFKEMFTAITALLFGFYHFLRSLVGVIQLRWVQDWATTVATLMERGGYWEELQPESQHGEQRQSGKQKKQSKKEWIVSLFQHQKSGTSRHNSKRLDMMKVNNSIVDNELADNQCPNVAYVLKQKSVPSFTLWFLTRVTIIFAGKRRNFVEAKLTTFVRWAVAYLAQFGNNWLMDVADTALVQSELRRTNKSSEFAVKVLAAATLRMGQTEGPLDELYKSDIGLNLVAQKSHLPLGAWHRLTQQTEDIVFSREEFARSSLRTSFHMPGNIPVLIDEQANGVVDKKGGTLDYRHLFDPLIAEARSALHPTLREYLQRHGTFSSQQLEWFAAFLCTQCVFEDNQKNTGSSSFQEQQDFRAKIKPSIRKRKGRENENDTTVCLLRRQLGLEDNVASRTFFYPFLKDAYERHFWKNRAILEVSARVDNWIAICSGRHVSFLLKEQPFWAKDKFCRFHGDRAGYPRVSCAGDLADSSGPDSCYHESDMRSENVKWSEKIFRYHRKLEIETLKYQLIDKQTVHWHMEHGLSFMGCVVESIRSALAEQSFLSGSCLQGWCPKLPDEEITFFPSEELWNCLDPTQDFDSAVQERLLWECQQSAHLSLSRKVKKRDGAGVGGFAIHREVEMMLLFLMGFPSIQIGRDSREKRAFTIRPALAPQSLQVHVLIHQGKYHPFGRITPTAVLRIETWSEKRSKRVAPTDRFCWRDWRDAFEGRLGGKLKWQQNHFLPGAKLTKGKERRETLAKPVKRLWADAERGKPPLLWDGWTPFRPGMAIFELKHVLYSKETEDYSDDSLGRHKSVTEAYHDKYKTTPALLSAAMLRLDVLLGHGEGLNKLDEDLKELERREKERKENESATRRPDGWHAIRRLFSDEGRVIYEEMEKAIPQVHTLVDGSKDFKAEDMYDLALCLDGSNFSTQELVFNLMQGALHIDRKEKIAESVINKLLTGTSSLSTQKTQEQIEKAKHAVDLLWLDVEAKHKKEWDKHARQMDEEKLTAWDEKLNGEKGRLTRIIDLHKRIVMAQPTATMMNELAERITKYGAISEHEKFAIQLYESSVIANADPRPILKLATIYASKTFAPTHNNDLTYACNLLNKAMYVAKTGPHDDILDGHGVRLQNELDVMEELYELAESGDRGAKWLFTKHYDVLRSTKDEDERELYNQLQLFLKDRNDDEYAKQVIGSDSVTLDIDP